MTTTAPVRPPPRLGSLEPLGGRGAVVGTIAGSVALVALWAWVAGHEPELLVPSPAETLDALVGLATEGVLLAATATTLGRAAVGVALALTLGACWGLANGLWPWVMAVTRPALAVLLALPPVVLVVLGLTWFGPGAATTRLVIVAVALPMIVVAVAEAVRAIDRDLLEMAAAFRLGPATLLRHVVAPSIASPVLAATSVALGQSLRVAVMAELLSATDGVGAELALARTNLETADVFAWAVALVAVVMVVELAVLRPLTRRLLRWREIT